MQNAYLKLAKPRYTEVWYSEKAENFGIFENINGLEKIFSYVSGSIPGGTKDTLIRLMFQTKWMTFVRKDHYRLAIYEYLTQDLPSKTAEYLSERVKKMSTNALISQYNEYLENEKSPGTEHIVFAGIFMPLLKKELENRSVQI